MDGPPVDLLKQVHPVYGGAIGFGFWVLLQCWRAWREFKREQRGGVRVEDTREEGRKERLSTGFAALDASRDKQIARLNQQIASLTGSLERADLRLEAKAKALIRVEEDRDRGWNLARECDDALHDMRHYGNDQIMAAYAAGQRGAPMPSGIPPVPPLHTRAGKQPD
jgi:hypothetical protein